MTGDDAWRFGREWVDAWNAHDLDAILSHYADDIEFTSPFVVSLQHGVDATIRGKVALQDYFERALTAYPDLKFELHEVLTGTSCLVLYYTSVNHLLAAEMMILDDSRRVIRVWAHYSSRN